MSAEDAVKDKVKRRRGLRRQAEAEAVEEMEEEVLDDEDESDDSSSGGLTERKGRATPSRRTQEVEITKTDSNFLVRYYRGVWDYLRGANDERKKVVWPTRTETRRLTTIVLVVTIIASIVLGIISLVFNAVIAAGLSSPLIVFGGLTLVAVAVFVVYLRASNQSTGGF